MSHIERALARAQRQKGTEASEQAAAVAAMPMVGQPIEQFCEEAIDAGMVPPPDAEALSRQLDRAFDAPTDTRAEEASADPAGPAKTASPGEEAWTSSSVTTETDRSTFLESLIDPHVVEKTIAGALRADSVEQYRRLAGLLHHAQEARGIRVIMVASAVPGEGKTLTASNLALTLSESFQRSVLLIDADLRRPSMHHVFRLPNETGLSDSLHPTGTGRVTSLRLSPQLTVLPAGPATADPMSGLTSDRMRKLLSDAAERFDWVIIDTPPVALLPDANLLGAMVDGAVLVVGAGSTHYGLVQRAVAAIGRDRILGVVLNRYQHARLPGAGNHYDYYYYRSYGYGTRHADARGLLRRLWPFGRRTAATR